MNLLEAIYNRRSRRSYADTPIQSDQLQALHESIARYNKESGLSMQLIEDGGNAFNGLQKSYGMFSGVRSIIVVKGKKADPLLREKCGYYGEFAVLEATAMGLGTCWVGASFDKKNKVFDIQPDEEMVCVITVGPVAPELTTKEKFIRKMAHGKVKPLEYFYTVDTTPPHWFLEGIQAVQTAPSAVNRQKYHFNYINGTVCAHSEDNSAFGLVDLGIAKAHFVIATGGTFAFGNKGAYTPIEP